ncbi:glutathione S-transferase family protein [Methylocapsa palsarum]|uniref:Glutathione S-transferase n=1 Tax=Methylocapsa palsarum TaxID=1612308 RepID=A0A1I3Z845_9HYPH|nr:glutathione S-transferase family protein [Methylocapsa palsarum]SFK40207.1 glutathione S-transferase [Methylocapsa palsarum]
MTTLYWAPRTRSLRALWVLEESGAPYVRVRLDLFAGEQKTPHFRAINPMAKVPALADGALNIAESGAICAYVAEAFPDAGLAPPVGDPARGRYLQWLFFSPGCVEPAFLAKSANVSVRPETASFGDFDRVFDVLEAAVEPGPWLLGEQFTAADVMIGLDLYFGIDVFKLVPERPALRAYVDRCLARPALRRVRAIEAAEG